MTEGAKDTTATQVPQQVLETHGWVPDPKDERDLTVEHPGHTAAKLPWEKEAPAADEPVPTKVDLREWFPPPIDQGNSPICTGATVAGIAAYFAKRAHGVTSNPSVLFNYRVSRTLSGQPNRSGSLLRYAMSGWALCGTIDEQYWAFDVKSIDVDPAAFCYAVAHNYRSISYFRVDHTAPPEDYLASLKATLARGLPVTLGIHLYPSLVASFTTGVIPVPGKDEQSLGGHAVLLIGYDDTKPTAAPAGTMGAPPEDADSPPGAFLIRNSWGTKWGEAGYGWLPYGWILGGLVKDSWTVLKDDWVDLSLFSDG